MLEERGCDQGAKKYLGGVIVTVLNTCQLADVIATDLTTS